MGIKARKAEADFLRRARIEALTEQSGCCKYCFEPLTIAKATADHVVARRNGGTNARANIVACCAACNVAKGCMTASSFLRAIRAPLPGSRLGVLMAWSRRRIWLATHRASRNIRRSVGLPNESPVGLQRAA